MATRAAQLPHQPARRTVSWLWFREFIRWEVAPYPGRVNTVIRMTIAATLVMIIVVTFRIPNAALAGVFSILLARENLAATWRGGQFIVLGFVAASLYTLLGMMLFRGYPITHFFWVIGSLYLIFFVMRTTTNYAAALAFAIPIGVALPIWDRYLPSQVQVEGTLWPIVIIAVGSWRHCGNRSAIPHLRSLRSAHHIRRRSVARGAAGSGKHCRSPRPTEVRSSTECFNTI